MDSSSHSVRMAAETAAILAVFSMALAVMAVGAVFVIPLPNVKVPAAMGLAVAGVTCAYFSRDRRQRAELSTSGLPTAGFVMNLVVLLLAALMLFTQHLLRM
jgi:hypothetical protein